MENNTGGMKMENYILNIIIKMGNKMGNNIIVEQFIMLDNYKNGELLDKVKKCGII